MILGYLSLEIKNARWRESYRQRAGVFSLWQFLVSLTPRLNENLSLKGDLLIVSAECAAILALPLTIPPNFGTPRTVRL
ncbi:hypothetical protein AJ87_26920 [Rhizobium yanglingense]|nr:hypothetical protein AJ87_26920 [Rhizobium yanglingense]